MAFPKIFPYIFALTKSQVINNIFILFLKNWKCITLALDIYFHIHAVVS